MDLSWKLINKKMRKKDDKKCLTVFRNLNL